MKIKTGCLFYVMGASGVGKDALLGALRKARTGRVHVACRYTTRTSTRPSSLERGMPSAEFERRLAAGEFWLCWQSYNVRYGVRRREAQRLTDGWHVVVNGSRAYLAQAQALWPDLIPVLVTCDNEDELRRRLAVRGREGARGIEARIARGRALAGAVPANTVIIDNSGELSGASARFQKLVSQA